MFKCEKQIRSRESLAHYELCTTGVCWSYWWRDNNSTYCISTELYYSTSMEYENVLLQFAQNSGLEFLGHLWKSVTLQESSQFLLSSSKRIKLKHAFNSTSIESGQVC